MENYYSIYGIGFASKTQMPFFMLFREDYINGEVCYATPVFTIWKFLWWGEYPNFMN